MNLDDEIEGVTNGRKLQEIINMSLKYAPRNWVLIGVKTKEPLRVMFNPQQPRQNLLRKSYVNFTHRLKSMAVSCRRAN